MPIRVLLVGHGARDHAIAEALSKSPQEPRIFSYMESRNPGILRLSEKAALARYADAGKIQQLARIVKPDIAIVNPLSSLHSDAAEALKRVDVPCVGPPRELARIETSKSYLLDLMSKYWIPSPRYKAFTDIKGIKGFMKDLGSFVVKPDGSGKPRIFDTKTIGDALSYCSDILRSQPVVVEEKLEGEEFSVQSLTDGRHMINCPPAQAARSAFSGDRGPHTLGMGSYSCGDHMLPFLKEIDIEQSGKLAEKLADGIFRETGRLFRGALNCRFMLTTEGVRLLEAGTRLGDPECLNSLPLMRNDFIDICFGIVQGNLQRAAADFSEQATVCKYVVPSGYPSSPSKGKIDILKPGRANVYYNSVEEDGMVFNLLGGRGIAFVGISPSLEVAEQIAQQGVNSVRGPVIHRGDIGTKAMVEKKISHMARLLSDSV